MITFNYFPVLLARLYLAILKNLSTLLMIVNCSLLKCVDPVQ